MSFTPTNKRPTVHRTCKSATECGHLTPGSGVIMMTTEGDLHEHHSTKVENSELKTSLDTLKKKSIRTFDMIEAVLGDNEQISKKAKKEHSDSIQFQSERNVIRHMYDALLDLHNGNFSTEAERIALRTTAGLPL